MSLFIKESIIFLAGIIIGVFGLLFYNTKFKEKKDISWIISHSFWQGFMSLLPFIVILLIIYFNPTIGFLLLPYILGITILFKLKYLPEKCKDKDNKESGCYDVRCDYITLKLYGKVSYTLIIVGAFLTVAYCAVYLYSTI